MKKTLIIGLLLLLSVSVFASIRNIDFNAKVNDTLYINNTAKITKYNLSIKFPNIIKKVVTFPKLNSGEIYTFNYNTKEKTIYYPLLKQTVKTGITSLNYIKIIFDSLENINLGQNYKIIKYKKTNTVKYVIILKKNIIIKLSKYIKVKKHLLPSEVYIYTGKSLTEILKFTNMKIN